MSTLIMKFGGASVATPDQFAYISDLIILRQQAFKKIVVVVSAMKGATDALIQLADQVNPAPPQREYDMLISVGERMSMSLLAMALCRKSCEAVSFTGSQSGIITCNRYSNARIVDVKPHRLEETLNGGKVVVVAGFQGVSDKKEITTLGRGGSDTTAVALGLALRAEKVEFYKDVRGIFAQDPKNFPQQTCFPYLSYEETLALVDGGAKVLHPRAVRLAAQNGLPLEVRSYLSHYVEGDGTAIYSKEGKRREIPIYEL